MLTRQEVRYSFRITNALSKLCLLPVTANEETGELALVANPRRVRIWKCIMIVWVVHLSYLATRLVQSLIYDEYFVLQHLPFHVMALTWNTTNFIWCILCFYLWPQETVLIYNEIYSKTIETKKTHWSKYTAQEVFTISHPLIVVVSALTWVVVFMMDPHKTFYVYSLLGPLQNTVTYILCGLLEGWIILMSLSSFDFGDFMMLSFFNKVYSAVKDIAEPLESAEGEVGFGKLYTTTKSFRRLNLLIQLFNHNFAYVTFTCKIACIISAIVCFYFAIIMSKTLPVDSLATFILGMEVGMIYVIVFDQAFGIPDMIADLQTEILLRSVNRRVPRGHAYIKRVVRSYPRSGIKVGSFTTFECDSTPTFVDFVFNQVVGLLLM